jgi:adenylate cyclase
MDEKKRAAAAIRDYLARERISREQFAFKTKLGKSTVDKLLTGLFSDKTLAIVESHTNLPLRQMLEGAPEPAPGKLQANLKPLDRPSIAVLPFSNMSGDPEQDYLSDGISEDIITALARLRWLFVIARIPASPTREKPWTCGRSRRSSASATSSKAACVPPAGASA